MIGLKNKQLCTLALGAIQQLRGQEEGEGGSAKSPRLSTQGGGGSLECLRGPKPRYFRKHLVPLCTRMGGKKEMKKLKE